YSERSLYAEGRVVQLMDLLAKRHETYTHDGALWFRASAHGDEKDRVLMRANGAYTYFAPDLAYHLDKMRRGYDQLINVLGSDHHGYAPRIRAGLEALGEDPGRLEVRLVQFAVLYRAGQRIQMSTRSGSFVTLRELIDEVGRDAARFFYVLRSEAQHLDFDLDLAKSQSQENPVYYVQYAHARIRKPLPRKRGSRS
ncbi:arginyl-tRNA synthetase, partial [mine drainage metagenome]